MPASPPVGAQSAVLAPSTQILRKVDIYEEDGTTPFYLDAPFIDGSVNVDASRDERRSLDLTLDNIDGAFDNYPEGFWYDKVIKVFRGVGWEERNDSWLVLDGTANTQVNTPDSPNFTLTSNWLRFRGRLDTSVWPPAADTTIFAKWNASGTFMFHLYIMTTGALRLQLSTTGANTLDLTSSVVVPSTDDYIGFDLQINNGASGKTVTFLTSADGLAWTQLGTAQTSTALGTTQLFDSSANFRIGAVTSDTGANRFTGKIHWLTLWDDTRLIVNADFTESRFGDQAYTDDLTGTAFSFKGNAIFNGGVYEDREFVPQIGEFIIDRITTQNFPHSTKVTGRDYTAKLVSAQLPYSTTFASGTPIEDVVQALALNGGVTKLALPTTGKTLGSAKSFEAQTSRWQVIKEICAAYNYEAYFDSEGFLVIREYQDPVTSATTFTFETGVAGNLATYEKSASSARLYNQVVVRSESSDTIPFTSVKTNVDPGSPTSTVRLGYTKTFNYTSPFIYTQAQADSIATSRLKIVGLEAFELALSGIVIPWLEVADIVEFIDPDPNPQDPTRFLLVNFSIPLKLGSMSASANRVTVVS